jgi:DNA-binding CsgD family transcriptional regulator
MSEFQVRQREREILAHACAGAGIKETAVAMGLAPETVKQYRHEMLTRLKVHGLIQHRTITEAAVWWERKRIYNALAPVVT